MAACTADEVQTFGGKRVEGCGDGCEKCPTVESATLIGLNTGVFVSNTSSINSRNHDRIYTGKGRWMVL